MTQNDTPHPTDATYRKKDRIPTLFWFPPLGKHLAKFSSSLMVVEDMNGGKTFRNLNADELDVVQLYLKGSGDPAIGGATNS